jgi:hypothetical protein
MGASQFGRGVVNEQFAENIEVDIQRNTANQFDTDVIAEDVSSEVFETGEQNISGATEISGLIQVNDSNSADITVEWTDGAGNVVGTEQPSNLQEITDQQTFNIIVKSTHFNLKTSGTSTDVDLTVNAH